MNDALKWALHSFKARAFSVTHDQLQDEVMAILDGQARIAIHSMGIRLIYAENDPDLVQKTDRKVRVRAKSC